MNTIKAIVYTKYGSPALPLPNKLKTLLENCLQIGIETSTYF
jgi:hypothetical protein